MARTIEPYREQAKHGLGERTHCNDLARDQDMLLIPHAGALLSGVYLPANHRYKTHCPMRVRN